MDDDELFASLSQRLREGHRRVAALDLPDDEKGRAARRLLAISDAAKHDLARASLRLDRFLLDLDVGWRPDPHDDEPPSA